MLAHGIVANIVQTTEKMIYIKYDMIIFLVAISITINRIVANIIRRAKTLPAMSSRLLT